MIGMAIIVYTILFTFSAIVIYLAVEEAINIYRWIRGKLSSYELENTIFKLGILAFVACGLVIWILVMCRIKP